MRPIEDQLSGIDGIDDVSTNISEGRGGVTVAFLDGEDIASKLDEVKTEVDGITTFPADVVDPVAVPSDNSTRVLEIAIHGDTSEQMLLRDIATVTDGFEDADLSSLFNSSPAVSVNVFRVGDEQIIKIVDLARQHLRDNYRPSLEQGIEENVWQNEATQLQSRIDLLTENAVVGLGLVILCLALFLDIRFAFWSVAGIAASFASTLIVMGIMGISINMTSLFGFILAIGIVVDNAIVVSENIYKNSEDEHSR